MKEIIKVVADDKELKISIDGDNIDIYMAIAEIVREVSKQRNIEIDTSMRIIKRMVEE